MECETEQSEIIQFLRSSDASRRLINCVSRSIKEETFPYSRTSEIPLDAVGDSLYIQTANIPGIGKKSAYEFVRLIQAHHSNQNVQSVSGCTGLDSHTFPDLTILEALEIRDASKRLQNTIAYETSYGVFPFKKLDELTPLFEKGALDSAVVHLQGVGKKCAAEFVSIVNSFKGEEVAKEQEATSQTTSERNARRETESPNKIVITYPNVDILEVLKIQGASIRLQNAITNAISTGNFPFTCLDELAPLTRNHSLLPAILKLDNLGKRSALEFISIVDRYQTTGSAETHAEDMPVSFDVPVSFEAKIEAALDISLEKPYDQISLTPADFYALLLDVSLNTKEHWVIQRRITSGYRPSTLEEVGKKLDVTRERVRQIQVKGLNKIRARITAIGISDLNSFFAKQIESQLFNEGDYLLSKSLKKVIGESDFWLQIHVLATAKTSQKFMNQNFTYIDHLHAWVRDIDKIETPTQLRNEPKMPLTEAIKQAHWPITVSELTTLMGLPGQFILAKLETRPDKYSVRQMNGNTQVVPLKVNSIDSVRYTLRRKGVPMSAVELQNDLLAIFGKDLNVHNIRSIANRLPDGLIVDTGMYALYENLHLSEKEVRSIRNMSHNYLQSRQEYISSKVIRAELSKGERKKAPLFQKIGDRMLLGILQDDDRFVTSRGLMVGLSAPDFQGEIISLRDEIVGLLESTGRTMSAEEIIQELSDRRDLIVPSLISNLAVDPRITEVRPSIFSLTKDDNELEHGMAESYMDDLDF